MSTSASGHRRNIVSDSLGPQIMRDNREECTTSRQIVMMIPRWERWEKAQPISESATRTGECLCEACRRVQGRHRVRSEGTRGRSSQFTRASRRTGEVAKQSVERNAVLGGEGRGRRANGRRWGGDRGGVPDQPVRLAGGAENGQLLPRLRLELHHGSPLSTKTESSHLSLFPRPPSLAHSPSPAQTSLASIAENRSIHSHGIPSPNDHWPGLRGTQGGGRPQPPPPRLLQGVEHHRRHCTSMDEPKDGVLHPSLDVRCRSQAVDLPTLGVLLHDWVHVSRDFPSSCSHRVHGQRKSLRQPETSAGTPVASRDYSGLTWTRIRFSVLLSRLIAHTHSHLPVTPSPSLPSSYGVASKPATPSSSPWPLPASSPVPPENATRPSTSPTSKRSRP